jgi:hypothetical protein
VALAESLNLALNPHRCATGCRERVKVGYILMG